MAPPALKDAVIGLIGMGEMGKMYAERLSKAGQCNRFAYLFPSSLSLVVDTDFLLVWDNRINVCDLPEKYESIVEYCKGQ